MIEREDVRDLCTDAVFERGENYLAEGRIRERTRMGDTVTSVVRGSRLYDLRVSLSAREFHCTCPYDGPGECKHVVALLLSMIDDPPPDRMDDVEDALADADDEALRAFLRDELARDSALLDRFLARFGADSGKSPDEYRSTVDRLFDEHAGDNSLVWTPVDFSPLREVAEQYRERNRYRAAAAVYRGLAAGIDDNIQRVDGAYDHFAKAFADALDAYVECVAAADLDPSEREAYEQFLRDRIERSVDFHSEQFRRALAELESKRSD